MLIVGGGSVAWEKLNVVLQNSPGTHIRLVATHISNHIKRLVSRNNKIRLIERPYLPTDLDDVDIVISAVNDNAVSEQVRRDAEEAARKKASW